MTFYYVLYFTMYFGPVAFMYKINNLSLSLTNITLQEVRFWPIDSQPSCPGLYDLRIAYLHTSFNMRAILLYYNITDQLSD